MITEELENDFATYLFIATINFFACTRKSHALTDQAGLHAKYSNSRAFTVARISCCEK